MTGTRGWVGESHLPENGGSRDGSPTSGSPSQSLGVH